MKYIVYKTTCVINNKSYIGIHQTENLDDGYLGSGVAFKRALRQYGKESFSREIIEVCTSFEELLEREKFYVNEDWVKDRNNYNLKTGGQSSGILSEESKDKISKTLKEKYESGELVANTSAPYIATKDQKNRISETLKERYRTQEHHLKGVEPWNKGKKGVQIPWNKGKEIGPMSEEEKLKRSNSLKKYWSNNIHPTKGKPSWNKGRTDLPPTWNKGIKLEKIQCPHCEKFIDKGNAKRWHFNNCKNNKMNNIFKYKEFEGSIEYSEEDNIFFGKILNIIDLVSYENNSIINLELSFQEAVEAYAASHAADRLC